MDNLETKVLDNVCENAWAKVNAREEIRFQ